MDILKEKWPLPKRTFFMQISLELKITNAKHIMLMGTAFILKDFMNLKKNHFKSNTNVKFSCKFDI